LHHDIMYNISNEQPMSIIKQHHSKNRTGPKWIQGRYVSLFYSYPIKHIIIFIYLMKTLSFQDHTVAAEEFESGSQYSHKMIDFVHHLCEKEH